MKKDLNLDSIIKDSAEPILQPMDQVFTDIENTVHYGATTQNTEVKAEESTNENSENQTEQIVESSENQIPQETVNTDITATVEEPITTKTSEQ
jgi:hypothetical protein